MPSWCGSWDPLCEGCLVGINSQGRLFPPPLSAKVKKGQMSLSAVQVFFFLLSLIGTWVSQLWAGLSREWLKGVYWIEGHQQSGCSWYMAQLPLLAGAPYPGFCEYASHGEIRCLPWSSPKMCSYLCESVYNDVLYGHRARLSEMKGSGRRNNPWQIETSVHFIFPQ